MTLVLSPITLRQAWSFVLQHHRHHRKTGIALFGVCVLLDASDGGPELVGVAIAGRPKAGGLDDGRTLEVLRCCVLPSNPNACSMLYRALVRAGEALGYRRFVTYTLESEHGRSLKAAGFIASAVTRGGEWSRRARVRAPAENSGRKIRWEAAA